MDDIIIKIDYELFKSFIDGVLYCVECLCANLFFIWLFYFFEKEIKAMVKHFGIIVDGEFKRLKKKLGFQTGD